MREESSINKWKIIDLNDRIQKFACSRDQEFKLLQHTFDQWKESHKLKSKVDTQKLGKKLARVLDGELIESLYRARNEKDALASAKKAAREAKRANNTSIVFSTATPDVGLIFRQDQDDNVLAHTETSPTIYLSPQTEFSLRNLGSSQLNKALSVIHQQVWLLIPLCTVTANSPYPKIKLR